MLFVKKECSKNSYHCGGSDARPFYHEGIRNPCCFKHLLNCLSVATNLLDEFGCRYWLDCASLLGQYRHGGLLPWDLDIDFSIFEEDAARFLNKADELKTKGFWTCYRNISDDTNTIRVDPSEFDGRLAVFKIQTSQLNKTHIDLYTCKLEDGIITRASPTWPAHQFPFHLVDDLERIDLHGFKVFRPTKTEEYLKYLYGDTFDQVPAHRIDDMKKFEANFSKYKKVLNTDENQYRFWS